MNKSISIDEDSLHTSKKGLLLNDEGDNNIIIKREPRRITSAAVVSSDKARRRRRKEKTKNNDNVKSIMSQTTGVAIIGTTGSRTPSISDSVQNEKKLVSSLGLKKLTTTAIPPPTQHHFSSSASPLSNQNKKKKSSPDKSRRTSESSSSFMIIQKEKAEKLAKKTKKASNRSSTSNNKKNNRSMVMMKGSSSPSSTTTTTVSSLKLGVIVPTKNITSNANNSNNDHNKQNNKTSSKKDLHNDSKSNTPQSITNSTPSSLPILPPIEAKSSSTTTAVLEVETTLESKGYNNNNNTNNLRDSLIKLRSNQNIQGGGISSSYRTTINSSSCLQQKQQQNNTVTTSTSIRSSSGGMKVFSPIVVVQNQHQHHSPSSHFIPLSQQQQQQYHHEDNDSDNDIRTEEEDEEHHPFMPPSFASPSQMMRKDPDIDVILPPNKNKNNTDDNENHHEQTTKNMKVHHHNMIVESLSSPFEVPPPHTTEDANNEEQDLLYRVRSGKPEYLAYSELENISVSDFTSIPDREREILANRQQQKQKQQEESLHTTTQAVNIQKRRKMKNRNKEMQDGTNNNNNLVSQAQQGGAQVSCPPEQQIPKRTATPAPAELVDTSNNTIQLKTLHPSHHRRVLSGTSATLSALSNNGNNNSSIIVGGLGPTIEITSVIPEESIVPNNINNNQNQNPSLATSSTNITTVTNDNTTVDTNVEKYPLVASARQIMIKKKKSSLSSLQSSPLNQQQQQSMNNNNHASYLEEAKAPESSLPPVVSTPPPSTRKQTNKSLYSKSLPQYSGSINNRREKEESFATITNVSSLSDGTLSMHMISPSFRHHFNNTNISKIFDSSLPQSFHPVTTNGDGDGGVVGSPLNGTPNQNTNHNIVLNFPRNYIPDLHKDIYNSRWSTLYKNILYLQYHLTSFSERQEQKQQQKQEGHTTNGNSINNDDDDNDYIIYKMIHSILSKTNEKDGSIPLHSISWMAPPTLAVMLIHLCLDFSKIQQQLQSQHSSPLLPTSFLFQTEDKDQNTPLHLCAANLQVVQRKKTRLVNATTTAGPPAAGVDVSENNLIVNKNDDNDAEEGEEDTTTILINSSTVNSSTTNNNDYEYEHTNENHHNKDDNVDSPYMIDTTVLSALQKACPKALYTQNIELDTPLHLFVSSPEIVATHTQQTIINSNNISPAENNGTNIIGGLSKVMDILLSGSESESSNERKNVCEMQDNTGATPLHSAIANACNSIILNALIDSRRSKQERNRACCIKDHQGMLPLHYVAAFTAPLKSAKKIKHANPDAIYERTSNGDTPLHIAVSNASRTFSSIIENKQKGEKGGGSLKALQILELLVNDAEDGDDEGEEEEEEYVQNSDEQETARRRDPLCMFNNEKLTPLHCCALFDVPLQVTNFLKDQPSSKIALVSQNNFGCTPLHLACSSSSDIGTCIALASFESSQIEDNHKRTALHIACQNKNITKEIIHFLLKLNPNCLGMRSDRGHLPTHFLMQSSASRNPFTVNHIINRFLEIMPDILSKKNKCGNMTLHEASKYKASPETISLLIERYPEALYVQNEFGNTPLHLATAYQAPPTIVKILLEAYPEAASIQNRTRETPLHYAACYITDDIDLMQNLIKASHGSSLLLLNSDGQRPLDRAKASSNFTCEKLLREAQSKYCKSAQREGWGFDE